MDLKKKMFPYDVCGNILEVKCREKSRKKTSQSILVNECKGAKFVETVNEWFGNEWSSACTRCVFVCFFNFLEILLRENINEESIS